MQRTNVRIQKEIYQGVKKRAVEKETSFQKLVNEALSQYLLAGPAFRRSRKHKISDLPRHRFGTKMDKFDRDFIYGVPQI